MRNNARYGAKDEEEDESATFSRFRCRFGPLFGRQNNYLHFTGRKKRVALRLINEGTDVRIRKDRSVGPTFLSKFVPWQQSNVYRRKLDAEPGGIGRRKESRRVVARAAFKTTVFVAAAITATNFK